MSQHFHSFQTWAESRERVWSGFSCGKCPKPHQWRTRISAKTMIFLALPQFHSFNQALGILVKKHKKTIEWHLATSVWCKCGYGNLGCSIVSIAIAACPGPSRPESLFETWGLKQIESAERARATPCASADSPRVKLAKGAYSQAPPLNIGSNHAGSVSPHAAGEEGLLSFFLGQRLLLWLRGSWGRRNVCLKRRGWCAAPVVHPRLDHWILLTAWHSKNACK